MRFINDNLALTVNTTFYDFCFLALFIDMYDFFRFFIFFFYIIYLYIFTFSFFIVFLLVTAPLNRVTWNHGAI